MDEVRGRRKQRKTQDGIVASGMCTKCLEPPRYRKYLGQFTKYGFAQEVLPLLFVGGHEQLNGSRLGGEGSINGGWDKAFEACAAMRTELIWRRSGI